MKEKFLKISISISNFMGSPTAFLFTVGIIIGWLLFNYFTGSKTGGDLLNLTISVVSLLLLIILQMSQNRSERAAQLQRSEIIRGLADARNDFIGAENKSGAELEDLSQKLREDQTQ